MSGKKPKDRRSRRLRRDWLESRRSPSPDALVERVQLIGLQRPPLEHLDHSRLDAGEANTRKHAQVKGQCAIKKEDAGKGH